MAKMTTVKNRPMMLGASPKGLAQCTTFVMPCEQEVGGRGEGLPMRLADVSGNKQVGAGSQTIAFLKEFVEEDDDEGADDELNDLGEGKCQH